MMSDMLVVQGLCNLRTQNVKKAGHCFEEARLYKGPRKTELVTLMESKYASLIYYCLECVHKMVQTRVMEYFRDRASK
jgi:hypothetical protein